MASSSELAPHVDYTLLRPNSTRKEVVQLCRTAHEHGFAAACVPPCYVEAARRELRNSATRVCTVIGFPMGYASLASKLAEAKNACSDGADELDFVINLAYFASAEFGVLADEVESLTEFCRECQLTSKLIIETGLWEEGDLRNLASIVSGARPDFVKTSTGFNGPGASVDVVRLLRAELPDTIEIKASGGIRTAAFARQLLEAGATRLGSSRIWEDS